MQPVFGYYMVPWADARVAVGATVEEAGFDPAVTAGGVHEVLRETLRVMPGLAAGDVARGAGRPPARRASTTRRSSAGCPGTSNVVVATGHGANGLLLGPVTGAIVADLVHGRDPEHRPHAVLARALRLSVGQRSSFRARSAMMFFCTSVGPAPIVV